MLKPTNIILLDEPTAHLDEVADTNFIRIISHQMNGRTGLMATHSIRLAAVADRIIRLGEGA
jgi:ATP-binding cassette subfamily C protein CydD